MAANALVTAKEKHAPWACPTSSQTANGTTCQERCKQQLKRRRTRSGQPFFELLHLHINCIPRLLGSLGA